MIEKKLAPNMNRVQRRKMSVIDGKVYYKSGKIKLWNKLMLILQGMQGMTKQGAQGYISRVPKKQWSGLYSNLLQELRSM